ncbi:uncharacterized protein RHOBADRAFT_54795 [Rhodotorula graminis WP1]|uniref:Rgp1-domain-containing protein n=1 Tax=Rhodotorula graminis (strain WP1) TaxID=578459 RepID=A0A0P9EWD9_RHOGW|nr:uncharacterized protein RHOBADRAFT_54795 [Rhodotorula graminis WP1]KPV73591.1 hypothetical protein RHOBADRAFT_54795 [Rhodotorula graminis WP1]
MSSSGGLSVSVSPGASAFFAGELFTATVTLRNTLPPSTPRPPPSTSSPAPPHAPRPPPPRQAHAGHARAASSVTPSSWQRPPLTPQRDRSSPGYFDSAGPSSSPARASPHGSTLHPSLSAAASASTSHLPSPTSPTAARRITSAYSPSLAPAASPSSALADPALPTRKGLIGTAPTSAPASGGALGAGPGAGLYANGPRRPGMLGAAGRGHARAQSMAVSSPDLRLGGAAGGGGAGPGARNFTAPAPALAQRGYSAGPLGNGRRAGKDDTGPPSSDEMPSPSDSPHAAPDFPDDAAFPVSASTSSAAPPIFPRRPTFGHQRTPSHLGCPGATGALSPSSLTGASASAGSGSIYGSGNARARISTFTLASQSDSESDDERDPAGAAALNGRGGLYGARGQDESPSAASGYARRFFSAPAGPGPTSSSSSSRAPLGPSPPDEPAHDPNTISVLWAFAHLEGAFEVDESLIKPAEFLEVKRLLAGGQGGVGVGGGTLEERRTQGGWRSWLFSGGGAGGSVQGGASGPGSGRARGRADEEAEGAASLEERKRLAVEERAVPMLSCPPSILGVDVVLKPGESRSYTYTLRIPADLPPSFRGKAIKFNYHLVVGTHRILLSPSTAHHDAPRAGDAHGSVSRVMRVPLRVYNHVGVTGARPFYDLTNPVIFQRDEATVAEAAPSSRLAASASRTTKPAQLELASAPSPALDAPSGKADFESYASTLLASVVGLSPDLGPASSTSAGLSPTLEPVRSPSIMEAPPALRPEMSSHRGGGGQSLGGTGGTAIEGFGVEEESGGCKAAVEIVSRNSQKVSYDINKDGYQVASLTLVKSAYRLGETVNGSVLINGGEGRVLRVSARLETHELVETSISTLPAPRMRQITRRQHAEHHEMVLDSARIGFALAIPSGATPDFGTSGVKLQWSVKLSFLVIPPSPDAPVGSSSGPPSRRGTPTSNGAATPPRSQQGGGHGRSKSFAYGFEPAVPLTLPPPPMILPSGAAHLMPVPHPPSPDPTAANAQQPVPHVSYRAVPDLGFVPVPFSSASSDKATSAPPAMGPLQKTARGAMHRPQPSISSGRAMAGGASSVTGAGSTVLVPAKVETVECSIPIKCYPGNTPFRPTVSVFEA